MGLIRLLFGREGSAEPVLSPAVQQQYRELPHAERRRLLRKAEEEAAASLRVDPSRNFAAERDAWIEMDLGGGRQGLEAAYRNVSAEGREPDAWKRKWEVIVGQDDEPDGPWGWMIIQVHAWPAEEISRVPVAFATREEARAAGEAFAARLWDETQRRMAELGG